MLFVNESNLTVRLAIGAKHPVIKPRDTVEIEDGYALPRRYDNGSRRPSVVEEIAPQLKPADPQERLMWEQTPEAPQAGPRLRGGNLPTIEGMVAAGIPLGKAELIYKQTLQAAIDGLDARSEDDGKPDPKAKGK
jgi:hypothetical protein